MIKHGDFGDDEEEEAICCSGVRSEIISASADVEMEGLDTPNGFA